MVLLIVDTQTMIMNEVLYEFQFLKNRIETLVAQARRHSIGVMYARHDDGAGNTLTKDAQGSDMYGEFKPLYGEKIVDKDVNNAFKNTGLTEYLRDKGEDTIMITGLQTEYCISTTIIRGSKHGFRIVVPAYTSSMTDNNYMSTKKACSRYNSFIWKDRYASCVSFEGVLGVVRQSILCRQQGRNDEDEGLKRGTMQVKDNRLRPAVIRRYLPDAWISPLVYLKEREAKNEGGSILQNHNGSRICINRMRSAYTQRLDSASYYHIHGMLRYHYIYQKMTQLSVAQDSTSFR